MKQVRLAFLEFGEPALPLGPEVEEELVAEMAEAILAVFERGGIKADERDSDEQ